MSRVLRLAVFEQFGLSSGSKTQNFRFSGFFFRSAGPSELISMEPLMPAHGVSHGRDFELQTTRGFQRVDFPIIIQRQY